MRRNIQSMAAKRSGGIPADCVEVAWLKTDGAGSYLDTGVTIASDISFTINCSKTSSSTSAYIIGALQGSQILLSCGFQFQIGGGRTASVAADTSPHVVECSFGDAMTIDGRSYPFTTQPSTSAISGRTMYVGCRNLRGATDGFAAVTIYSLVIRKAGTVLLDLVPVRRVEGGVSVGYLCDRLTGQLYGNRGSGSFVIGPDK